MKHTGGDWKHFWNGHFYEIDTTLQNRLLSIHVMLYDDKGEPIHDSEENEANVKLLKAAPKMLEGLKDALEKLEGANHRPDLDWTRGNLRNLIKAAE